MLKVLNIKVKILKIAVKCLSYDHLYEAELKSTVNRDEKLPKFHTVATMR